MVRVLIVDGQAEVRWGLRMRLAIEPDMVVVGETGNADDAPALAERLEPDVIVVDIGMRGAESANIVKRLRAAAPGARIVVLTLRADEDTWARAQEAGAQAFLDKYGGAADLLQVIRRSKPLRFVVGGGAPTGPLETRRLSVG